MILNEGRLLVVDTPENIKRSTGSGDALRIEIEPVDEAVRARGLGALKAIAANGAPVLVELESQVFTVRCFHVVDVVADVVNALRALGFHIRFLSIRENTLEDAFISLTGRSLASESAETVS